MCSSAYVKRHGQQPSEAVECWSVGELAAAMGCDPVVKSSWVDTPDAGDCLCGVDIPGMAASIGATFEHDDAMDIYDITLAERDAWPVKPVGPIMVVCAKCGRDVTGENTWKPAGPEGEGIEVCQKCWEAHLSR